MALIEKIGLKMKPQPVPITFDSYEEFKGQLQAELSDIEAELISLETVGSARENKAYLNKVLDRLKKNRLDTQKILLSEFRDFESKSKELEGMIQEAINTLDEKIKKLDFPEPKSEHTLKFTCTDKQFTTLLKAFERQGVDVEEVIPEIAAPVKIKQETKAESEPKSKPEPKEKSEEKTPEPEIVTTSPPEEEPPKNEGKQTGRKVFEEFVEKARGDEPIKITKEETKEDLLMQIGELQKAASVSEEQIANKMGKPIKSLNNGELRSVRDLLKKQAAILRLNKKGA